MRVLLIDDMRNLPADHTCRTYEEGIKYLQKGPWDLLLLDHDLGDFIFEGTYMREKTGYDVLCWLERNPQFLPKRIELVTANPVGRQRMESLVRRLYG